MLIATIVIVFSMSYAAMTFALSRRRRPTLPAAPDDLLFVMLVPCLNEAAVIRPSLDRLLETIDAGDRIVVIDDGSDDGTGDIVEHEYAGRVALLRRTLPDARRGKGEALNAGCRFVLESGLLGDHTPDRVVVGILDADGRVSPRTTAAVAPYFADPRTGAVQIGVRMYNASDNILCRLQDMEFVVFTELFQRGREWLGSVGLGGNGQFARLSALQSLGDAPWTQCLTEDLDLGVRLLTHGWKNSYCSSVAVQQEAVPTLRRLARQRSRWFQGHLQCSKLIPTVLRSTTLSVKATVDIVYQLTGPLLVLVTSFVFASFAASVVWLATQQVALRQAVLPTGAMLVVGYALTFGMAPVFGWLYAQHEPSIGKLKAIALAHLYTPYAFVWFVSGWAAVWRVARRRGSWSKTARLPVTVEVRRLAPAPVEAAAGPQPGDRVDAP